MSAHRRVRPLLYDFARGLLTPAETETVAEHLRGCDACRCDLAEIDAALRFVRPGPGKPADHLPDGYWREFARRLEMRIAADRRSGSRLRSLRQDFGTLLWDSRRWAVTAGAMAVAAGILLLVAQRNATEHSSQPGPGIRTAESKPPDRMEQLLRRSKALLVGIDNMKAPPGQPLDLLAERRVSRELIREARTLRGRLLDPRSALIVRDLERILIELANTEEHTALPDMEIVRSGMRRENILFRLRMAEAASDSLTVLRTRYTFAEEP